MYFSFLINKKKIHCSILGEREIRIDTIKKLEKSSVFEQLVIDIFLGFGSRGRY